MTQVNLTKCLQTILDTRRKRSTRKAYIFVDLKKAYDSVRRDLLFKIMMGRCQNDEERNLVLILSRLFLNTRFQYGETQMEASLEVAQDSVTSPFLFNVYLEHALKSSPLLATAIENGSLLAFADDLLIMADNETEAKQLIRALDGLKTDFKLHLNKVKTKILSDKPEFKGIKEVDGVAVEKTCKYLGDRISLDRQQLLKDAKNDI